MVPKLVVPNHEIARSVPFELDFSPYLEDKVPSQLPGIVRKLSLDSTGQKMGLDRPKCLTQKSVWLKNFV